MQFPTQFPFLVIPTGASTGQRITINYGNDGKIKVYDSSGNLVDALGGPQGQFILYDSSGNMVVSLASAAGTDDKTGLPFQAGITTYTANTAINMFENDVTVTASNGSKVILEASNQASVFFTPSGGPWDSAAVDTALSLGTPYLLISSPADLTNDNSSQITLQGSSTTNTATEIDLNATKVFANGLFSASSIAVGQVSITPSAANTPTSAAVSYGPLGGTLYTGLALANTTAPGTAVTGVSMSAVGSTSANVWLTRTNTTATGVFWMVWAH